MTSKHHNRRISENVQSAQRDVLRHTDLDERLLVLDRNGRVTINLNRLAQVLQIPTAATGAAVAEVDTFDGAGTTGLVPDPLSSSGRFLDDAGDWTAIPGGGDMLKATYDTDTDGIVDAAEQLEGPTAGLNVSTAANVATHLAAAHAPVGHSYVAMGLDATLTAERVLAVGAGASLVLADGGANGNATLTRGALTGHVTAPADSNTTTIPAGTVTNAMLADMAAQTIKLHTTGTGPPSDATVAVNRWIGRGPSGSIGAQTPATVVSSLLTAITGGAFPGSPEDGEPFYHTGYAMSFHYDDTIGDWLSDSVFEIAFGDTADVASGTYFRQYPISSAARYSSTLGERFGFPVRVVGIVVDVAASSTCTITVQDDGADVSGGAISLAGATNGQSEALGSGVIAAASVIGVKCTSGTATTGTSGRVRFRRVQ